MKPTQLFIISSLCILGAPTWAAPTRFTVDATQSQGQVEFRAIGRPSMLKIVGKGDAPRGQLEVEDSKASGTLTFDLSSLDTGIKLRNEHMKDKYLEVGMFKEATLKFTQLPVPPSILSGDNKEPAMPFDGTLSLHGVEKPVSGTAAVERAGDKLNVAATFKIKVKDFAINSPSFAGITMADDVDLSVNLTAPMVQGSEPSKKK